MQPVSQRDELGIRRVRPLDRLQLIHLARRSNVRRRTKQQTIDDVEHRRVRADAEREGGDRAEREGGCGAELPPRDARVDADGVDPFEQRESSLALARRLEERLSRCGVVAEPTTRLALRISGRPTSLDERVNALLNVERHLSVDVARENVVAPERQSEERSNAAHRYLVTGVARITPIVAAYRSQCAASARNSARPASVR